MVDVEEVFIVTAEVQPKGEDEGWDDDFPSSWIVERFYNRSEAVDFFYKYVNHDAVRSCFMSAPILSLDTPTLERWAFPKTEEWRGSLSSFINVKHKK